MSSEVNTSFVLDMQRKLYRWSSDTPDKVCTAFNRARGQLCALLLLIRRLTQRHLDPPSSRSLAKVVEVPAQYPAVNPQQRRPGAEGAVAPARPQAAHRPRPCLAPD